MEIGTVAAVLPLYVLGLVAAIACVFGAVKSFTKVKHNGLVWALACGVFLILAAALIENRTLASLPVFRSLQPNVADFIAVITVLAASVFFAVGVFAVVTLAVRLSTQRRLRLTTINEAKESGDDEVDSLTPLPVERQLKPRVASRIFGGLAASVNALAVVAALIVLILLILHATPLREGALSGFFSQGASGAAWSFLHKYALDLLAIAYAAFMVRKGLEIGFLEGLRKIILFVGVVTVLVGPFLLLFLPLDTPFTFLNSFGEAIGAWLSSLTGGGISAQVGVVIGKIVIATFLSAMGCLCMVALNGLMRQSVMFVAEVRVLSGVERGLATVLFFVFAISAIFVATSVLYTLDYYELLDAHLFFREDSPIIAAFYGGCERWLNPLFEQVALLIGA